MKKKIAAVLALVLSLSACNKTEVLETTVTEITTEKELTTTEEAVEPTSVFETEETSESEVKEGSFGERLLGLKNVTRVEELDLDYEEKDDEEEIYMIYWEMPLDHGDPDKGRFEVRMAVRYTGDGNPNVFSCSGYEIDDGVYEWGPASLLMNAYDINYFESEFRFYGKSLPEGYETSKIDFLEYLTDENAAGDFYEMVTELKTITSGGWTMTGSSKGGLLTVYQEYIYPDTADLYIAEVAPVDIADGTPGFYEFLSIGIGDLKYGKEQAGEYRNMILALQVEAIRNRDTMQEKFWQQGMTDGYTYTPKLTKELLYDMAVAGLGVIFWQYNDEEVTDEFCEVYDEIETDGFEDKLFDLLLKYSGPSFYYSNDEFVIQCCIEDGYNSYDISYLREALAKEGLAFYVTEDMEKDFYTYQVDDDILNRFPYNDDHHKAMLDAIDNGTKPLILVNGNSDVWAPFEVTETNNPNTYIFNVPEGNHLTSYEDFDDEMRDEFEDLLEEYGGLIPKPTEIYVRE